MIKPVKVDLDVVKLDLSRCDDCKRLPIWTAHGPTVGYTLECDCRSTGNLRTRSLAIKSWRKHMGFEKI